jgi:hypothetical protein
MGVVIGLLGQAVMEAKRQGWQLLVILLFYNPKRINKGYLFEKILCFYSLKKVLRAC